MAIWAPNSEAYQTYSANKDPNGIPTGNCVTCHGVFDDPNYISRNDGTAWGTDLHVGHRSGMLNRDCNTCHLGDFTTRYPVSLNVSNGGTGFDPISCVGCHGRDGDLNIGQIGAGLRQHHTRAGAAFCGGCHADNDPATFTPVGEDTPPSYYFTPDAVHPDKPTDPCNANAGSIGQESVFGTLGLDNDGDLRYDQNDFACGAVNTPPVADPNGPYTGVVGVAVMFDGTGSSDPDGTIVSYDWDFGDGSTGTGPQPQHAYAAPGVYDVTLTVTDDAGDTSAPATTTATIDPANQAPTADPNGPYTGTVGVPVTFDGSGSSDPDGTIVSYDWDFGDGTTGTGVSPTYIYATDGAFTVTLTVTDNDGATSAPATTTATIGLGNQPPVADPNGPYTGTVGTPVSFDGTGSSDPDGTIDAYDWDFGDGTIALDAGPTPTHTYATANTFNVTLTVTDDAGATDSATTTAMINPAGLIEAEVDAPGAINGRSQGRTPFGIEIDEDGMLVEIAEVQCGAAMDDEMPRFVDPVRVNREDGEENEFVALFNTQDLQLQCEDNKIVCEGTLADGRSFEGMDEIRVIRDVEGDRCK
jgi:PKD repeat protein